MIHIQRLLLIALCGASCSVIGPRDYEDKTDLSPQDTHRVSQDGSKRELNKPGETADWQEARGSILRTFAFRALEKNLVEEARQYLTEACELDPNDVACHAALARLYLADGDAQSALIYAERAATVAPGSPEVSMVYAAALAENNRMDEATATLETAWQAVENDPVFARAILTHYSAMGQTDEAKDFVHKVMMEDPNHATSWALAGDLLLAEGDLEAAGESYRKALEIDPNIPTPSSIELVIGKNPAGEDPLVSSAKSAEAKGDLKAAANLYRFLADTKPLNMEVRLGLSRVLWAQNRYEQADYQLSKVALGVRGWRGHVLQAKIDIHFERYGSARTALKMALRERPDQRAAELLLAYVEERIQKDLADGQEDA
ncbi:MAG: tetratricopeptide repeat protein [Planctomycetota bacterium]|jgi:Tfp pilus assembly protein PilF|nr:tetratricopeptide repeat protein [Planctomycetota bacterium]